MIKKMLGIVLVLLMTFIFSAIAYSYEEEVVARLDDENITVETLADYVDDVAGDNYKSWLRDKEGLRKLADFYINRTLLLEYARKTVNQKDTIVTSHNARSVDEDVMYLTSLLKMEVQDKVNVSDEEVAAYMKKNKIDSDKQARQAMESALKNELMADLIEKVRSGHEIIFLKK